MFLDMLTGSVAMCACMYEPHPLVVATILLMVTTPQGIIGQDNRCYVVDLFRMLPPDANWFNCK